MLGQLVSSGSSGQSGEGVGFRFTEHEGGGLMADLSVGKFSPPCVPRRAPEDAALEQIMGILYWAELSPLKATTWAGRGNRHPCGSAGRGGQC